MDKINIIGIIHKHFKTLVNSNTKKADFWDWFVFLVLPLIFSGVLLFFNVYFSDDAVGTVITVMTVLVGLLFNVIVILFDIVRRDNSNQIKNQVLEEVLANISYSVLLAFATILFTLLLNVENSTAITVFTFIVYFLCSHFFLTALMILKRIFKLFDNEMKKNTN
ncbi:hypothetical protein [Zunongwangia sp. HGR-M22]|uniref:hypothetical protein n=1 Tax=Zunongwangia sp. HGR-M22 TaxID=3015168 RepID=UPI0022DD6EB0|nr:hypothetical protein [Zunongwangia sp. HGR-M22]WBL25084.1 hypothetical protein PBT91_14420 [Zunongwangia sp. HGR-M22]